MTEQPRFTLELSLRDNQSFDPPLRMCIGVDGELRISSRAVEELKIGIGSFDGAVRMMKAKEFRKDMFVQAAKRLAHLLAERMEDAEGWHDQSRIEPARKELGWR